MATATRLPPSPLPRPTAATRDDSSRGSDLAADLPRLEDLPPLDGSLFTPLIASAFALPHPRPRPTAGWRGGSGGASASGRPGTYGSGGASGGVGGGGGDAPAAAAPAPPPPGPYAQTLQFLPPPYGVPPYGSLYYDPAAAAAMGYAAPFPGWDPAALALAQQQMAAAAAAQAAAAAAGGGAAAGAPPPQAAQPARSPDAAATSPLPDDGEARALKRARLVWTPQLHQRFLDAVDKLGDKAAVPKTIMNMMNVEGLSRENVASHLQKYRLSCKKRAAAAEEEGRAAGGAAAAGADDDDAAGPPPAPAPAAATDAAGAAAPPPPPPAAGRRGKGRAVRAAGEAGG